MTPDAIRRLRERLDLTQVELAAKIPVSPRSINRWENGSKRPSRLARLRLRALMADATALAKTTAPRPVV